MEIIERPIVLPENQSFIIRDLELKHNKGIIHTHKNYELNYIVDAFGRRFVSGNISKFYPGDLVFLGPGVPHCWEIDNKKDNPKAIVIHFNQDFFEKSLVNIPELYFLKQLVNSAKQGIFFKDLNTIKVHDYLKDLLPAENTLESIIKMLNLLKFISLKGSQSTLASTEFNWDSDLQQNQRLKKIYEYVFFNFQGEVRLREVAALVGITEGAFCSYFKKNTKKTFSSFIKEVRIGFACKLLHQDKDKPISEVCFESGYNSFANFNRQFKEVTGLSPKEYRMKSYA